MALTSSDINKAAAMIGVEPCAVQAVIKVESDGHGFLMDGRPKILFEGHVFFRELSKRNINPKPYVLQHPDIVHPAWTKAHYRSGAGEWDRLETAIGIHRDAALCSASWGLFQIMGFNYRLCEFPSVEQFVDAQKESEARQLESFCAFMRSDGLILFLASKDWTGFAMRYNGKDYARNQYDAKLRREYDKCKATS